MEVLGTKLITLIQRLESEFELITEVRKVELQSLAKHINKGRLALTFICTHNSRRSQLAEVWVHALAACYNEPVAAYSGGTEATAFNHRMVEALRGAGFALPCSDEKAPNPVYRSVNEQTLFSKVFDHDSNPREGFIAVMVCSDADDACPFVAGATTRFPLRYKDPKEYDDTALEAQAYTDKVAEIGREMIYLFKAL